MYRIVAVIPARADSKGIPNKNIRLINGKPMIAYAIDNAINSSYITDILVTSDSEEIKIIANQMGVTYKARSKELCADDVTLDRVIYDAVEKIECDYVVTMQPTSPTLSVNSLDRAIKYCIENNLDTVLSGINRPHLSWGQHKGKKYPKYKKRLNRQYLPEEYEETGAFLISKAEVISSESRIGEKVDIFEISEEEAIDIDTFRDLLSAETMLGQQSVAVYVNGNNNRGMGHIYRVLELADEFYCKPDIFYDINQTDKKIFGRTTHNLIPVNGIAELFSLLKKRQYTLFINDILTTSIDYMIGLKTVLPEAKIVNFEDDGEGAYKADLVINALYQNSEVPHMRTGEKYYISSKLFMFYGSISIKEYVNTVFISFGGADPQNYTDRALKIISQEKYKNIKFKVVLGRAKLNISKLLKYNERENIEVHYDICNMPEIMISCDIGITSRGRTGYELAMLGIPSIAMAQNEREEKHGFVNNENGFCYLGLNPSDEMIEANIDVYINMSKAERERQQRILLRHNLRNGRRRVMSLINDLF